MTSGAPVVCKWCGADDPSQCCGLMLATGVYVPAAADGARSGDAASAAAAMSSRSNGVVKDTASSAAHLVDHVHAHAQSGGNRTVPENPGNHLVQDARK
eukprot:SM000142S00562  [mRNA]  locus=s142:288606:289143:- [translate_table: standard]